MGSKLLPLQIQTRGTARARQLGRGHATFVMSSIVETSFALASEARNDFEVVRHLRLSKP
jgi:hypothetical protein